MITFEVIINEVFTNINSIENLHPTDNKNVLSLINNFEDGRWRFEFFQNFIWDNIAETSLSYRERESLVSKSHSLLTSAAQNLRLTDKAKDISKGSEIAEIVLYGIMKDYYQGLPVVPKIFYKQNPQDNAKGSDSVHIVLVEDHDFSIWFGEAKFYNSIEDDRLGEVIQSVQNSITTEKLKKENSIITNVSDIDFLISNDDLRKKIKEALCPIDSIDDLKSKIHIPILLLYECELTKSQTSLSSDYKDQLIAYHKKRAESYFSKQIDKIGQLHKYSEIKFHIILFPVPNKEEIVNKFVSFAEMYKKQ